MYLVGNVDTYSNIPIWQSVVGMLRDSESVGRSIGLCCPRHKDTAIEVSGPEDISALSPKVGCRQACVWRLTSYGHMCLSRCHSESMHNAFSCPQPCQRRHEPCKHACRKQTCEEDCGNCTVRLDTRLPCRHLAKDVFCCQAQDPESIYYHVLVEKRELPNVFHHSPAQRKTPKNGKIRTFISQQPLDNKI